MREFRLIPLFVLVLLLSGQVLILTSQAYAQVVCCQCGNCWNDCTCPGESPECEWCAAGDYQTFQSNAPAGTGRVEIRGVRKPLQSTVANSDVTEPLMELVRGEKRVGGNFILKMLGSVANGLKFACPGSADNNMQANTLAFQMEANKEK